MAESAPVISVLICTRNRSEKVEVAVRSILDNTFTDFELLIVDQSTDGGTAAVMRRFDDQRIRYIHTDTVGLSRSRNIAIRESRAEIIAFTDDDCICDSEWLACIVAEFEADPSLSGVYGRVLSYGEARKGMICHCLIDAPERLTVAEPIIPFEVLGHGNNMSFRKSVFRSVGLYIESLGAGTWMKGGEDTELIYRALRKRLKFSYTPAPLVYHDNWMPEARAAQLECGYILAAVAVFTSFALRLDTNAAGHVLYRGRLILERIIYFALHRESENLRQSFVMLKWYFIGLAMGLRYFLVPPPHFSAGAAKAN